MYTVGIGFVAIGFFICLGYVATLRRAKMREKGDRMLDQTLDETAAEWNVPRHAIEPTPENMRTILNIGVMLMIIGLAFIVAR